MQQIPMPKIYYEALQGALEAQVKRLARDISQVLKQPEVPFLKHLAKEKLGVYLFEEEGSEYAEIQSMRCPEYVPHFENPAVLVRCNEPILIGSHSKKACPFHCAHPAPKPVETLNHYRLVNEGADLYWVDAENTLYSLDLKPCGRYSPITKMCKKFVKIEETISKGTILKKNGEPSLSSRQSSPSEPKI